MDMNHELIHNIGQINSDVLWLSPLILIPVLNRLQPVKNFWGELKVNLAFKLLLDAQHYKLFSNITLRTLDGSAHFHQLIVSPFGVFLINTRSVNGVISGASDESLWTQQMFGSTIQFENPINKIDQHRLILQSAFNLNPEKVFTIIVFPCDSAFKAPMPSNVVNTSDCINLIKDKTQVRLSPNEVAAICNLIKPTTSPTQSKVQHCPHCGHKMLLKSTKNPSTTRQYWSCSNTRFCSMTLITKNEQPPAVPIQKKQ